MAASLDFWFDFASTYSYVGALRVEALCAAGGLKLSYKPFLLGPLFSEQLGIRDSPFNAFPVRGRYMWRDLERLCAKYSLPWRRPTSFPRNSVLAARVACVGIEEAWGPDFVRSTFRANFAEDGDIADAAILGGILERLHLPAAEILERAVSVENKACLREQTAQAAALGMFGAPNFVVAGEMFFGQDRLEDAIQWALSH